MDKKLFNDLCKSIKEAGTMNESKLEIFIAKMKVAASNGSSGPENTTNDGRDPMMQRWLYFTEEQLAEQDERIIRLCLYPKMIPDEILVAYADVLLVSLSRLRRNGRLYSFVGRLIDGNLRDHVMNITKMLNIRGDCVLAAKIEHEMGPNPDGTEIGLER